MPVPLPVVNDGYFTPLIYNLNLSSEVESSELYSITKFVHAAESANLLLVVCTAPPPFIVVVRASLNPEGLFVLNSSLKLELPSPPAIHSFVVSLYFHLF